MKYDLLLRNGTVVSPRSLTRADVAVADGHIVAVEPELEGDGGEEIDATGLHIFPGLFDAHVHFHEPGRAYLEGFTTGTRALAAGGVTSYFDMPINAAPPPTDGKSFHLKLEAASKSSLVDFALWGGLIPGNLDHLEELAALGAIGFKAFMSNPGTDDFSCVDDLTLYEGMARAAQLNKIVAVHAENNYITDELARRAIAQGRTGIRDYLSSRPAIAEIMAIQQAILLAEETGCSLHIVHVSTGKGVSLIAEARARNIDVSCETCPHYLVFTGEDVERLGTVAKCAPPIRDQSEQDQLWAHLLAGDIPMVASDHAPAPFEMKDKPNIFDAWNGISGCQSTFQLLLTEGYTRRDLPLTTIASLLSNYVARRFRLPQKGRIEVGADADMVLVDMQNTIRLEKEDLFYRHQHSPYVGMSLNGTIRRTLLRGKTVFVDGEFSPQPLGQFLVPSDVSSPLESVR
jgi:allantoinase